MKSLNIESKVNEEFEFSGVDVDKKNGHVIASEGELSVRELASLPLETEYHQLMEQSWQPVR